MHIAAECSVIAHSEYLNRHNKVAQYLHLRLLQINGLEPVGKRWYNHEPTKVIETEDLKILWDFNIYTDKKLSSRRPDIVIIYKRTNSGYIIDVNCPNVKNVLHNKTDKVMKYTDLKIELERIWGINFQIIPVVIGCLGAVSKKINGFIMLLGLQSGEVTTIQEIVLLSTCNILRKFITQSGLPLIE